MSHQPHDPTQSRSPVPDTAARFSRSEIESLCLKAARGAGLPWGLAEEAGMAARRLAEAGLPGPEWLLAYLEAPRGHAPVIGAQEWHAKKGALCPLITGAALADRGGPPDSGLRLRDVSQPGLLLAFLAPLVKARAWRMDWDGGAAIAGAAAITLTGTPPARADVTLTPAPPPAATPPEGGRSVPLDLWRRLDALALATTVPPSAASRAGAGAGTSDND